MRALLSLRFVAAVAGLFALLFIVQSITATDETSADPAVIETVESPVARVINLAERLDRSTARFAVAPDGTASTTATFTINEQRSLTIVEGTPGVNDCSIVELAQGDCVIFADLLGEAVVWFSLQPVVDDDRFAGIPVTGQYKPRRPSQRHRIGATTYREEEMGAFGDALVVSLEQLIYRAPGVGHRWGEPGPPRL